MVTWCQARRSDLPLCGRGVLASGFTACHGPPPRCGASVLFHTQSDRWDERRCWLIHVAYAIRPYIRCAWAGYPVSIREGFRGFRNWISRRTWLTKPEELYNLLFQSYITKMAYSCEEGGLTSFPSSVFMYRDCLSEHITTIALPIRVRLGEMVGKVPWYSLWKLIHNLQGMNNSEPDVQRSWFIPLVYLCCPHSSSYSISTMGLTAYRLIGGIRRRFVMTILISHENRNA